MTTSKFVSRGLNFAFTALLVVACGGGGGGGGGGASGDTTPPSAGVSITQANAELITAAIVNSVNLVEGVSSGSTILTGVSTNTAAGGFNYPDFFVSQLERLPALASQSDTGSVTGVVIPETTHACTEIGGTSGTYTESGNVSDPSTVSAGDTVSVDFNNCVVDSVVLNGAMTLSVTTITPNFDGSPPYTLGIDAALSDFSANDAGFIVTADGDMSILLGASISGDFSTVFSGSSLLASAAGEAQRLTNYQFDILENASTGDYSVDISGTIATTAIGGSVSFVTMELFTGNDFGASEPTAGVMWITTSADNSQARVTVQPDGINVLIEIDADGNSLYETEIWTTWAELGNS